MFGSDREQHEKTLEAIRRLEARLPFRFAILQRLLDRQITRLLGEHGLSVAAYRTLITIEAFEELSAADLVRYVVVDKALMSRTCSSLVDDGYLASRTDPKSARRKLLSITDKGRRLLSSIKPDVDARNQRIENVIEKEERDVLVRVLDKLTRHVAEDLDENRFKPAA